MAYFIKDDQGNVEYSYYGVQDCIPTQYISFEGIEAYIKDDAFQQAVINSYSSLNLSGDNAKDIDRVFAKMDRTATWLRRKVASTCFDN